MVTASSGNVFADVGLPNPEELLIKSQIVIKIKDEMEARKLTQKQTADIIEIPQPRLLKILRGQFTNVFESKLLHCLNKLLTEGELAQQRKPLKAIVPLE